MNSACEHQIVFLPSSSYVIFHICTLLIVAFIGYFFNRKTREELKKTRQDLVKEKEISLRSNKRYQLMKGLRNGQVNLVEKTKKTVKEKELSIKKHEEEKELSIKKHQEEKELLLRLYAISKEELVNEHTKQYQEMKERLSFLEDVEEQNQDIRQDSNQLSYLLEEMNGLYKKSNEEINKKNILINNLQNLLKDSNRQIDYFVGLRDRLKTCFSIQKKKNEKLKLKLEKSLNNNSTFSGSSLKPESSNRN